MVWYVNVRRQFSGELQTKKPLTTARRSRNQTQLQRLKPLPDGRITAGLMVRLRSPQEPGPPTKAKNSARDATNLRINGTEDTKSEKQNSLDGAIGLRTGEHGGSAHLEGGMTLW